MLNKDWGRSGQIEMNDRPEIKPGDWIRIGKTDAVVCGISDDGTAEVVYLDRKRAINKDVRWNGETWESIISSPDGGYADKYPRLSQFVQILRIGKNI